MSKRIYFDEHIEYLRENSRGRYNDEISKMFNEKFGMNATVSAINTLKAKHGIKSNVPKTKTQYTKEQLEYLKELCEQGLFNKEITEKFNKKFRQSRSERAISSIRGKYGITTNARKVWGKGTIPWNKGKKGYMGANKTSFKKGDIPATHRPVGSERICSKDGYTYIKIAEPSQWELKHRVIWEKHNGPLPDSHTIMFGDRDKRNFDINNLICVSRAQLLKFNQLDLIQDDADLTRTAVNIVNLSLKIGERAKGEK